MTDYEIRDTIRNRLIECRIESNLTQREVGEVVKKSSNAVASWEQGLSLPDIVTLIKLAKYYGKSLDFMFGEKDR